MTKKYLTPDNPEAFRGLEQKAKDWWDSRVPKEDLEACYLCKGYGGWILIRDAYGPKTGDPDGPRQHFKACCAECNGWGWMPKGHEPLDTRRKRIFRKFSPIVERLPKEARMPGCFLVKDKSVKDDPELQTALVYAADGVLHFDPDAWCPGNFGGGARFIKETDEGLIFRAWVYTD